MASRAGKHPSHQRRTRRSVGTRVSLSTLRLADLGRATACSRPTLGVLFVLAAGVVCDRVWDLNGTPTAPSPFSFLDTPPYGGAVVPLDGV